MKLYIQYSIRDDKYYFKAKKGMGLLLILDQGRSLPGRMITEVSKGRVLVSQNRSKGPEAGATVKMMLAELRE